MTDTFAAATRQKIPVFRTAYDGYRLGIGAIFSSGAMFRFFVYGSVSILAVFGGLFYGNLKLTALIASAAVDQTIVLVSSFLLGLLVYALIAATQTPLGVAVQRYALLGDSPKHSYFGYLTSSYGRRFFWVSITVYAYFYIAGLLYLPVVYLGYHVSPLDEQAFPALLAAHPSALAVIMSVWFVSYGVASLLSARTTFAFIIAAIDRPGPALQQAFAESRGAMWRLFFVFFLIFVPPVLVYFVASVAAAISVAAQTLGQAPATPEGLENWAMTLFLSPPIIVAGVVVWIVIMLSYVGLAAGAARAYQIRVERGLSGVAEVFS